MDIDKISSYINLRIGTESFAISVYKVLEIIHCEHITRVPNSSELVLGVLNFRGSIVPVINMHKRFKSESSADQTKVVVIVEIINQDKKVMLGLLVDQVTDVIEFEYKSIQALPELGIKYNPEFLEGFIEKDNRFIMVVNIDRVLKVEELSEVNQILVEG